MHGFVHAQAFQVGPIDVATAQAWHGLRIGLRDKLNILGIGQGLHALDQIGQRVAYPRNHHGPSLHAAHAVNALLHGAPFHDIFQIETGGFFHQAFNFNGPWGGF